MRLAGRRGSSARGRSGPRPKQAVWFVDIKGRAIHRFHEPASGDAALLARAGASPGSSLPDARRRLDRRAQDRPAPLQSGDRRTSRCCTSSSRTRLTTASTTASSTRTASSGSARWTTTRRSRAARCISSTTTAACAATPATSSPTARRKAPTAAVLYHTDTLAGDHLRLRSRAPDGTLSNKRVFARIGAGERLSRRPHRRRRGLPLDRRSSAAGACSATRRTGELLDELRLPCANVTKAAFGGEDLRTLYITTARKGLDRAKSARSSRSPADCSARALT